VLEVTSQHAAHAPLFSEASMAKGQVGTNKNNKPKLTTAEKQKKKKEKADGKGK
jgi:hypothetical protein